MMIVNQIQISANLVPLVITGGAVLLILGLIQLYLGLKAQKSPKVTGESAMIGETGIVKKTSGFMDRSIIEVRGELWWCLPASGSTVLEEGITVKIVGIEEDSMILEVDTE
ncbi:MAG: NfeD family protein [Candidatus Aegiribacteria sp.]|nr:NfeD family protein [Candidatus Aegiribacteria sp.]